MFTFDTETDRETRVIELADGRVLFFPRGRAGRAYEVPDYTTAWSLDGRRRWIERAAGVAATMILAATGLLNDWRILLLLLPVLAAPALAVRFLVAGLREATDGLARQELTGGIEDVNLPMTILAVAAIGGSPLAIDWWRGEPWTMMDTMYLIVLGLATFAVLVHAHRARRAAEELQVRPPGSPDNTPIVPR